MSDSIPPLYEPERREIAHDIRNSLGAMLNAVELLERRYEPKDREARLFRVLRIEIDRLRDVTDSRVAAPRSSGPTL